MGDAIMFGFKNRRKLIEANALLVAQLKELREQHDELLVIARTQLLDYQSLKSQLDDVRATLEPARLPVTTLRVIGAGDRVINLADRRGK